MYKKIVFAFLGILLFVLAGFAYPKSGDPAPVPVPEASVSVPIEGTQDTTGFPAVLVGGQFEYAVQRGDSLTSISARFGTEQSVLARMNGIKKVQRCNRISCCRLITAISFRNG